MSSFNFRSVLFLCHDNATLSQMAEGLARSIVDASIHVQSAGTSATQIHPLAIEVMAEAGVSVPLHTSTSVDEVDLAHIDLVITLDELTSPPDLRADQTHLHWAMRDPGREDEALDHDARTARFRTALDQLRTRIEVLVALHQIPPGPTPQEFHASIRVPDLPEAARFYSWLLEVTPRQWTHRYVTFVSEALRTNFVLLVDDGMTLHHDTLYHLGIDVGTKDAVIAAHHRAVEAGWSVHKPARTTWRGTPLHELWLHDPGGNLIEVYARLTQAELDEMPYDKEPSFLVK